MAEYRVWRTANGKTKYFPVASPEEGAKLIDKKAKNDLKNPNIGWNVFGLEWMDDGEWGWVEWYDTNGDDIDAFMEALKELEEENG
jgi:hypothetical protein